MLTIIVPALTNELWDEEKQEFTYPVVSEECVLHLEHSLISLSKWESKWNKSFINTKERTEEESLDYIRCMTLDKNISDDVYYRLSDDNIEKIFEYINAPMTATTVPNNKSKTINREIITSELIYYWMISYNIPVKFERWHLNRLITLIMVCNFKNEPNKKMSRRDLMSRNAAINAARRKKYNTKG